MDWKAYWISCPNCPEETAPRFVKTFELKEAPQKATLRISGVGFYTALINGRPVSDELLNPAFSRYDITTYYNEYPVEGLLKAGENVIEVTVGNGWYNELLHSAWDFESAIWRAHPQMICELYADGELALISNTSWMSGPSRVVYNALRSGETYDAACELPPMERAMLGRGPGGVLKKQEMPPIRVTRLLSPVRQMEDIYDFGVNTAGNVEIRVSGKKGQKVTIVYGERMRDDISLDTENIATFLFGKRFQTDEYILSGEGEEVWHSSFNYNGFRYVQIKGDCKVISVTAREFHTDLAEKGRIECDNELVMKILSAVRQSTLTNYHHIPTDCPHREKNGWTGDAQLSCEQAMFHFDIIPAYLKWMDDIVDSQRPNGQIPCIIPTSSWGYGWGTGPTWDAVIFTLPHEMYRYTGDVSYIERYYPAMRKYIEYLTSTTENYISRFGLGDWCPPFEAEICPTEVLLTGYYYRMACQMTLFARLLDKPEDERRYSELAEKIKAAFKAEFIGKVPDSQCYLSALLYFGMADDKADVTRRLVDKVREADGHLLCGIFGAKFVLRTLTENGRFDVAYEIASQRDYPGWGYMALNGEGTLWEHWSGKFSRNHHLFSDVGAWYFQALAGINIDDEHPGFKHVLLTPHIPEDIHNLTAWHDTPLGRLTVQWNEKELKVEMPEGMTATLTFDGQTIELEKSAVILR